jgi:hypothetical protein
MHTTLAASSFCYDENILVFVADMRWRYFVLLLIPVSLHIMNNAESNFDCIIADTAVELHY